MELFDDFPFDLVKNNISFIHKNDRNEVRQNIKKDLEEFVSLSAMFVYCPYKDIFDRLNEIRLKHISFIKFPVKELPKNNLRENLIDSTNKMIKKIKISFSATIND